MGVKITEELRQQIRAAKEANPSLSGRQLGQMFGVHKATANEIVQDLQVLFLPKESPFSGQMSTGPYGFPVLAAPSESSEIKGDDWTISIPKTPICTEQELIDHCKIDLTVWEIEKIHFNKWDMGFKDKDGEASSIPLFQVKAFCKRKRQIVDAKAEIEALKELAKANASKPYAKYPRFSNTGNMLEINIPDLHAGKLSWGEETGGPNYDTKIAIETFETALETLLYRVREHKFDEVLFVLGNDLLNSDNEAGTTTGGTQVNTDCRYQKTFTLVRNMKIKAIERLRQIAPVKVVPVSGNHDKLSVWHLGSSLECYFHKYDDVVVDNSPRFRKYHEFGNVMLMMTHGHKGKRADYPLTMASEQPEMFGRTKFREAHTGHLHGLDIKEYHGVRVRILSALCPEDAWHSENNFIGNIRSAEAFVWNKNEGLIGTAIYNEVE